jgi:hypothetical protein
MSELIWAAAAVAMTGMVCLTLLRGWRGWLELRRDELNRESEPDLGMASSLRIEVSGVKERLRKLEAIARGVDL